MKRITRHTTVRKSCWKYFLSWKIDKQQTQVGEETEKQLEKDLAKVLEELEIRLSGVEQIENTLTIVLEAQVQINSNKIVRIVYQQIKSLYPIGNKEAYTSLTMSDLPSKKDLRIQGIFKHTDEIAYYDLDEVCDEEEALKAYLSERPLWMLEMKNRVFLIDAEALLQPINLNCFACTKQFKYGCCCGSPCEMSAKNKRKFNQHHSKIEATIKSMNEEDYGKIQENGGLIQTDGSINEYDGRCSFLVHHEGVYKCITHKYALDENIPIYDLCPLSCLMYPLEIMEFMEDNKRPVILLTSVLEEKFAKHFGRWGSYSNLEVDLRCIDKNAHNKYFKSEDYKPVFKVNKGLLIHEFGKEVYEVIDKVLVSINR